LKEIEGEITTPRGFKAAGVHCGIKKNRLDLALIYSEIPAISFGMFTTNRVKAAPVELSIQRIRKRSIQAIVINSGIANACTGKKGLEDADKMTEIVAERLNIEKEKVLVASTGKIGEFLPLSNIEEGIKQAVSELSSKGGEKVAEAILTTDTTIKQVVVETDIPARGKGKVMLAGIAKGSGMISPNLATMLCFITTDVCITPDALEEALKRAVNKSFNQISVDGDMSTNDSVIILANGLARNKKIKTWQKKKKLKIEDENFSHFCKALDYLCISLAKMVARDGEGATKLIEIRVKGGAFPKEVRRIARAVANSPLVKAAIGGASPNWGRIMSALGSAHTCVDTQRVDVYFDKLLVVRGGEAASFEKEKLKEILKRDEVKITIDLHRGSWETVFWGCDLTEKYVKINKRYV